MSTVVLDTHVIHWWSAEPDRLSRVAARTLSEASELAAASISWFELAWLASRGRIVVSIPIRSWLGRLGSDLRTIPLTPEIGDSAVSLPGSFPGDPADRLIYATAVEHGCQLVTKDRRLHSHPLSPAVW